MAINPVRLGFGRKEQYALEDQIEEGMNPLYWYGWTNMGFDDDPDYDPDDGLSDEERRFDKMWKCDSLEFEEESDDFPCDEAVELDLREEDWRCRELHRECLERYL